MYSIDGEYNRRKSLLPPEDESAFAKLSPSQVQAEAANRIRDYQAQIERMQGLILELSLIHNDAAPIHVNLPTEVLIHIFRHLQPRSRRDIRLTHICRLWRLIIHRTPDFWVDMLSASESTTPKTGEDPAPYLTFISRTTPLSYHLDFRGDSIALLEHIPSNDIARLTAIIYTFHGRLLRDIPQMLNLDFPNLRGLVIHHTQTWYTFQLGAMLLEATARPDHFPRLHHLDVPAPLLLPCFAVPSLRSLTVGGLLRDSTQLERFLHTLQQCSQLESLTARHCHMALPTLVSSTVVHMPNISSLVVEGAGLALKNPVLRFVTFPSSTRWRVEDPYGYPLSKLFPTPLPAGTFSGLDKLFCKCAIEYTPSHSSLTVSVVGYVQGTPAVTITVQNTVWGLRYGLSGPSVVLPALANLFAASSTTISALELHFDKHIGVAVDDWTDLLRAFPVMSHLDVHINSCRHLLRSLRQEGVAPSLEALSVVHANGRGVHELLVSTVEARTFMGLPPLRKLAFHRTASARETHTASPVLSDPRRARLGAIVPEVSVD